MKTLLAFLLLCLPSVAPAAIAFDAAGNAYVNGATTTITLSFTVGNGSNRVLIVSPANADSGGLAWTGVTYGGVALTKFSGHQSLLYFYGQGVSYQVNNDIWYLVNPASGTANIVATEAGIAACAIHAVSYSGVNQATPIGAIGYSSSNSVATLATSITTTNANAVALCMLFNTGTVATFSLDGQLTTRDNSQTALNYFQDGTGDMAATTPGAFSITNNYTSAVPGGSAQYYFELVPAISGTPTNTPTISPTFTISPTNTPTATVTPTITQTFTNVPSATPCTDPTPAPKQLTTGLTPLLGFASLASGYPPGAFPIRTQAQCQTEMGAMISSGLYAAGYTYFMVDAGMFASRNSSGHLVPVAGFPNISAFCAYGHALGLKVGVYTDYGTLQCGNANPGSLGYEYIDASDFAMWGFDFVKVDSCNNAGLVAQTQYTVFGNAIVAAGRPVIYSVNQNGLTGYSSWAPAMSQMARGLQDMANDYVTLQNNFRGSYALAAYSAPGYYNNMDVLYFQPGGLTALEQQTQMDEMAMEASPLILFDMAPSDITSTPSVFNMATNASTIAVQSDALGKQGYLVSGSIGNGEVLERPLTGNRYAVLFTNDSAGGLTMTVNLSDFSQNKTATIFDTHSQTSLGKYTGTYSQYVPSTGSALLIATMPTWDWYDNFP